MLHFSVNHFFDGWMNVWCVYGCTYLDDRVLHYTKYTTGTPSHHAEEIL